MALSDIGNTLESEIGYREITRLELGSNEERSRDKSRGDAFFVFSNKWSTT